MYSEWCLLDCNERQHALRSPGDFLCFLFLLLATVAAGANDCNNANRLQSLVEHFRFHSIWLYALHPKWNPTPQTKHIFFVAFLRSDSELIATVLFIGRCVSAFSQYYFQLHASKSLIWFDSVRRCVVQSLDALFSVSLRESTACAFWSGEKLNSANAIGSRWRDFRIKSNIRLFAFNAKHFYLTRFAIVCRSLTRNLRRENYYICAMLIHETAR